MPADDILRLRLLATTDLHGRMSDYDHLADRAEPGLGLAHAAAVMDREAAGHPNVMRFDLGDVLQGSPLSDSLAVDDVRAGQRNPVACAMDAVGYDAGTPGNHDFNFGLDHATKSFGQCGHVVVASNLVRCNGGGPIWPSRAHLPRRMRTEGGDLTTLVVGVLGVLPPQTVDWDRAHLAQAVEVRPIVPAAAAQVQVLRDEGADIVLLLAHSGFGTEAAHDAQENAIRPLARLPGIDAIFAGHTHRKFPVPDAPPEPGIVHATGRVHGTPVAQAGSLGRYVGIIDLHLMGGPGRWRRVHATARLSDGSPGLAPSPAVTAAIDAAERRCKQVIAQPIARTETRIETYFAHVAPSGAVGLVAQAMQSAASTLRAAGHLPDLPILAATAPYRAGGGSAAPGVTDIAPGPFTLRHAADLCGFPNTLSIVETTGAGLLLWLERIAACFAQAAPKGVAVPLLLDGCPAYNVDTILGVRYAIDLGRAPRFLPDGAPAPDNPGRIGEVHLDGRPLEPEARVLVATSSYRAAGGGGYPVPQSAQTRHLDARMVRDLLIAHLRQQRSIARLPVPDWGFRAPPGSLFVVETDPAAPPDVARAAGFAPAEVPGRFWLRFGDDGLPAQ